MYEIDDKRLKIYDDLELYPINYNKKKIKIQLITGGDGIGETKDEYNGKRLKNETLECSIYIITDYKEELLSKPFISNYDNNPQKNKYIEGDKRLQFDNLNYDTKCDVKKDWPSNFFPFLFLKLIFHALFKGLETNNPNLPVPIFVYGTLKKGEHYHRYMSKPEKGNVEFVAEGETYFKFPLVIESKYNLPYLLWSPTNGEVSLYIRHGY